MVQRTSEALKINTGSPVQQQQSGLGFASADPNEFAKSHVISAVGAAGPDLLLNTILGTGKQLFDTGFKVAQTEAYLDGAAKAGLGKSELDLDANPIMRDWQSAGFRDTMGRLALADTNSRISADMPQLRQQSPEKFGEYLVERRTKLVPQLDGMSLEARKGMIASMAMDERSAIKLHSAEHYKWGEEQQDRAVAAMTDERERNLNAAKIMSPGVDATEAYKAAKDAAWTGALNAFVLNPNQTPEKRIARIKGFAQQMLSTDHQQVYEMMRDSVVTFPDGTTRTMLSELPADERSMLAGQYRQSIERMAGLKGFGFRMDMMSQKKLWDDPTQPNPSPQSVFDGIQSSFEKGWYGQGESAMKNAVEDWGHFLEADMKKQQSTGLASRFIAGDQEGLVRLGKTRGDAVGAWLKAQKSDLPTTVAGLFTMGVSTMWPEAFHEAGNLLKPAFGQLSVNDQVDEVNAKLVGNTLLSIGAAEKAGKEGVLQAFVGSMPEGMQDFALTIHENLKEGMPPTEAIGKARATLLEAAKAGPMAAAIRAQAAKDDAANLASMEPMGAMGAAWNSFKSVVSTDAANTGKLTARSSYWENPERVAEADAQTKAEVADEMRHIARARPYLSADNRFRLAKGNVAQRTVLTDWGPLSVPRGQTLETYFGVKDGERIGATISKMIKPQSDSGRLAFSLGVNGELMYQERRDDGSYFGTKTLDPRSVKGAVDEARKAEAARHNILNGQGETVEVDVGGKKFPITYNGRNALGVGEEQMFALRQRLIKHEGVKDKAYNDIGGKINPKTKLPVQTVGAGISDTNTFYPKPGPDGTITAKQASDSLRDASEEAAKVGRQWAKGGRMENSNSAFQLFSELAFQGGASNGTLIPLLKAVQARDQKAAIAALHNSAPYKWTAEGSARRKFYDSSLIAAFKE